MFKELISKLGDSLNKKSIPYMIIGGQAVLLYGEPRLTRDIDITLGVNTDRIFDILEISNALSLKPIPEDIKDFVEKTMVLPVIEENTGIRVDFIFSFTPYEINAIKRAKQVPIDNVFVSFASPEDTIIHKIFAQRPRDIEDIKGILLKTPVDTDYIKKWLDEFDKSFPKGKFLKTFKKILNETKKILEKNKIIERPFF